MRKFVFKSLSLSNFRSFAETQTLKLDSDAGLVLITGENKVDARLGGNGVGKSTIFDAISFALFGKTGTGVKSPDLKNWNNDDKTIVVLDFNIEKWSYVIERHIKPNLLLLNGNEVPQDEIDNIIGISHEMFIVSVLHGQNSVRFLDLSSALQLEYFTSLLNLDLYTNAGKIAGDKVDSISSSIDHIEKQMLYDRSAIIEQEARLEDVQSKEIKWLRKRISIVSDLQRELDSVDQQIEAIKRIPDKIDVIDTRYYDAAVKMERKDRSYFDGLYDELQQVKSELKRVKTAYDDVGICSACGQTLPDAAKAKKNNLDKQIRLREKRDNIYDNMYRAEIALNTSVKNLAFQKKKLDNLRAKEDKFVSSKAFDLQRLGFIKANQEDEIAKYMVKKTPYGEEIEILETRLNSLQSYIVRYKDKINSNKETLRNYQFWEKSFKDLRLRVIDTALAQMTFRSNSALHDLGLPQWKISVQAESLNKSGSVRRSMRILAGKGDELKPIGCFSGGETQRLRLAVAIGFSDLIQSIIGIEFNIELWDEPSSWLSQRGVLDLLDVLSERAELNNKSIFVADHRSLDYAFSEIITVTKTVDGSVLEVE